MEKIARWQQKLLLLPPYSYLYVGTNRVNIVLNRSPQENAHFTRYKGAPGRKKRYSE